MGGSSRYLSGAGHLQAVHWSGDLDALHLAVLAALVSDVLHDLLVLFVVQELFGGHHVHQTQHLGGHTAHLGDGAVQPRDLQRHRGLVYTRLGGGERQKVFKPTRRARVHVTPQTCESKPTSLIIICVSRSEIDFTINSLMFILLLHQKLMCFQSTTVCVCVASVGFQHT